MGFYNIVSQTWGVHWSFTAHNWLLDDYFSSKVDPLRSWRYEDQNSRRWTIFDVFLKKCGSMIIFCSFQMIIFCSFFALSLTCCSSPPAHHRKILIRSPEFWINGDFLPTNKVWSPSFYFSQWPIEKMSKKENFDTH